MDDMLRKIDEVRDRIHVSYSEAKEALERNNGSVVDAIIYLENEVHSPENDTMKQAQNMWNEVRHDFKGVVDKTGRTKIRVMKDGRPVAEVPAAAGVLGLAGALAIPGLAVVGAIGSVAAMMNKYSLEVKRNQETETREQENENEIDNRK